MSYVGDMNLSQTFNVKFTTRQISGAPFTLAGTPVISAYAGNSTTQITAGITLSVDFDGVTGLNNVSVVATGANGYATASDYQLVITTGTVNSVSVVGEVIAEFSIENRSAGLKPTVAGRTLDVSTTGEAGVDWANVGSPTTANALTATSIITTQKVDVDTIKTNPVVNGGTITFPTGATLASTTNITAGTIATVTNLTNAPINGDLTAAMKTSVTTAATAATPVANSVTGAVGSVAGLTASDVGAIKTKTDSLTYTVANQVDSNVITKTGFALSSAGITAIWAEVIEGAVTAVQLMRGFASALLGKASGLATTTAVYRDIGDTKDRITATVDADGNRTAVTKDLT